MNAMDAATVSTPLGPFSMLIDNDGAVRAAGFTAMPGSLLDELPLPWRNATPREFRDLSAYRDAIHAYFVGDHDALRDIPVIHTGKGFRMRAWQAMRQIPVGTTISYAQLAAIAGNPRAARAAGAACAANLVPLLVPCHRVVASDGGLNHYYYGLAHKRWLLEHEKARPQRLFQQPAEHFPCTAACPQRTDGPAR
ncbi:methylated-DNA--[protein]-cysteine S-methyltransferase [Saccharopolyspora sp. K220]|uniref:methylated-DNA--[protein]-cysteine S-methyltransferase n=1 Tax=Saccharopolyspora soli TaxID=2926618 RepID=UPI001F5AC024|nr:methylated-DNA--[protein]-cysteine S-methyltransferase [Saccharopolyspora soli]MCI2416800.1 methylated-DNA--[protein]-cysteine S-methyltransferase [Saccharopolyspora soli]